MHSGLYDPRLPSYQRLVTVERYMHVTNPSVRGVRSRKHMDQTIHGDTDTGAVVGWAYTHLNSSS